MRVGEYLEGDNDTAAYPDRPVYTGWQQIVRVSGLLMPTKRHALNMQKRHTLRFYPDPNVLGEWIDPVMMDAIDNINES